MPQHNTTRQNVGETPGSAPAAGAGDATTFARVVGSGDATGRQTSVRGVAG